ncbi:LCP family protein [Nocardioides aquaticus]|uniref:LCP family protein n=1 Tax=Nocardioides aquaticus TaxID=160826 RepID=UPI0031CDE8D2
MRAARARAAGPGQVGRRMWRVGVLGVVLAVAALVVPASTVAPTEAALVKVRSAEGMALDDDVVWILAVGSDARPGEDMLRTRGDALQLVGLRPSTGAATAIGIPRDSYVAVPGHGSDRVNAALTYGGPRLLGETVGDLVGIEPDYVMVTRFPFFEDMVDDIGGITVTNPRPFADPYLKDDGFATGRIRLSGYDAMAFSRIRKELSGGDFDRSANQQRVLRGIAAQVRARADEPGFVERGVLSVMEHLDTGGLPPSELFMLARAVASVRQDRITTCVVGGTLGNAGAASVVFPDVAQARRYGDDARQDARLSGC